MALLLGLLLVLQNSVSPLFSLLLLLSCSQTRRMQHSETQVPPSSHLAGE